MIIGNLGTDVTSEPVSSIRAEHAGKPEAVLPPVGRAKLAVLIEDSPMTTTCEHGFGGDRRVQAKPARDEWRHPIISNAHLSEGLNPYSYVFNSPMNWIDPSGFEPSPDVASSGDAASYAWGCGDCSRISSDPGYDPLGQTGASGNLTTSPDIAGVDAFPSDSLAGTERMPPAVGSWSPGSSQTGDVVPSAGTSQGGGGETSGTYNQINASIEFSKLNPPPGSDDQSVQLAAGPAVVVAGGLAACLASAPCRIGLGFAAILAFEGLKQATEAIVRASSDSTSGSEKEIKKAEQALRTNQDFRRWFHREYKPGAVSKDADQLNPDLDPEEILDAYQEWLASGSPRAK